VRATHIDPTSFSAAGSTDCGGNRYYNVIDDERTACFLRVIFNEADRDGTGTLNADEVTLITRCVRLELCLLAARTT
jgi:hypothetical protein